MSSLEVQKFLDYKMHLDADVADSAPVKRHSTIKSLLPTQKTHKILFNTCLDDAANIKHLHITLIH